MTRESIREYAAALRPRYQAATKAEKGRLLEEVCRTTGYHRKAAIRLLRPVAAATTRGGGRPRQYGPPVAQALRLVWEASGRLCSKRLAPFLAELVGVLEGHGELTLLPAVREGLLRLSPATIDRLLATVRRDEPRQPRSHTAAASRIRAQVPVRTFGEWRGVTPGTVQADLVLHCGASTDGFSLTTLVVVDVATSWAEFQAVWGKGQARVGGAVHHIRQRLPLDIRELHTDNGGEFLNEVLVPYCRKAGIRRTRGRPYKKNDQAYVEQKNGSVVRRLVGDDRSASQAAYAPVQTLYGLLGRSVNVFQPVRKVLTTERVGTKVVKTFDQAATPYRRLLAADVLTEPARLALDDRYRRLNPVLLRTQIDQTLEALWRLAEPAPRTTAAPAPTRDP